MVDVLDDNDILARLKAIENPTTLEDVDPGDELGEREYRYYRPLSEAADEYLQWSLHPEQRVYTGIPEFDAVMRGTAPGELTEIIGFSHSGKTVVGTELILNNPKRHIALFTPDETRVLVLVKITCARCAVSAETLERGLYEGNPEAKRMLYETAEMFPNLVIYDEGMNIFQMQDALKEAEDANGRKVEAFMFDYLEQLDMEAEVKGKAMALKMLGKTYGCAAFVLHQTSRTAGADGAKMEITSGAYGGEQPATHIIGVRRKYAQYASALKDIERRLADPSIPGPKRSDLEAARTECIYQMRKHGTSVTLNLVKNKRPPCDLVDDIDYEIVAATGRIRAFDLGKPPVANTPQARPLDKPRSAVEQLYQNAIPFNESRP